MPRVEFIDEKCKGCLLCTTVCPKAIVVQADRFNKSGYKVAEVTAENMDNCTGCAACAMICPDYAIRVYKPAKAVKEEESA